MIGWWFNHPVSAAVVTVTVAAAAVAVAVLWPNGRVR